MIEYEGRTQDINPRFIMKAQIECSYCLKAFYSYHNYHNNFQVLAAYF